MPRVRQSSFKPMLVEKWQTLLSAIYQFTPTFAPPDSAINAGNFASFLKAVVRGL